jgi:hypothetical protein
VAEAFELADRAAAGVVGVALGDDRGALLAVDLASAEHLPGGGQDFVGDRDDRFLVATAPRQAAVALAQVGALGAASGPGGLDQWRVARASPCAFWRTCVCLRTRVVRGTRRPRTPGARRSGTRSCQRRSRR